MSALRTMTHNNNSIIAQARIIFVAEYPYRLQVLPLAIFTNDNNNDSGKSITKDATLNAR